MSPFEITAIALLLVLGSARVARFIGFDLYPPIAWLRAKWDEHVPPAENGGSDWNKLVHCGYCSTPYIVAANLAWGYFTGWQFAWYATNIVLAASYAAAIVLAYDGDD